MACRNKHVPSICLCPSEGKSPRRVLAARFINSWLSPGLEGAARKLAADASVSEERLWRMLFTLEDEASAAHDMWVSCQ